MALALLEHYSFDLGHYSPDDWVSQWGLQFPESWVRLAVVEALYQGRYKGVSVELILCLWHRRGYPCTHFSAEFERLVCDGVIRRVGASLPPAALLPEAEALPLDEAHPPQTAEFEPVQAEAAPPEADPLLSPEDPSDFYSKLRALAEEEETRET